MKENGALPIKHWSYSSLMSFLRNPLAWYKRYVEEVYDTPSSPSSIVGRAAHKAVEHFYGGLDKEASLDIGLEYLRNVPDFEINFGKATSKPAKRKRRAAMEREYKQAVSFFLERPPRYKVLGVEVKASATIPGLILPVKAVSDLVVQSRSDPNAVDIVDHKFVDSFTPLRGERSLFVIQALFNYYTVKESFQKEVRRFIVHECKKSRNADGSPQLRRHFIDFRGREGDFALFHRLLHDATEELLHRRVFLPNPSDMFEGEDSLAVYRMGLAE